MKRISGVPKLRNGGTRWRKLIVLLRLILFLKFQECFRRWGGMQIFQRESLKRRLYCFPADTKPLCERFLVLLFNVYWVTCGKIFRKLCTDMREEWWSVFCVSRTNGKLKSFFSEVFEENGYWNARISGLRKWLELLWNYGMQCSKNFEFEYSEKCAFVSDFSKIKLRNQN